MLRQHFARTLSTTINDRADLFVNLLRNGFGVVLLLRHLAAQEDHLVLSAERDGAKLLGHAEARHHLACKIGRLLNVVRCAGRCIAKDELLSNVATEHRGDLVFEFALALQVAVFGRQVHRVAERHAAADHCHLADRIALLKDAPDHRVTTLVVGDDLLLCIGNQAALALRTSHHAVKRLGELVHTNRALAATCGEDRRLVHEVRKISSRESR